MSRPSGQLRHDWQREIRRYQLGRTVKLVAWALSLYAHPDGTNIYPGEAQLAADCGLTEKPVREALRELIRLGLLMQDLKGRQLGRQGVASRYHLALPDDLADRVELTKRRPPSGGRRKPASGTPGRATGDPDPEHRDGLPVIDDGTPGVDARTRVRRARNTGTAFRASRLNTGTPYRPSSEVGREVEKEGPDTGAGNGEPPAADDPPPDNPSSLCTTRGHKGVGWLRTRDCLDCLSAEETRARLAELVDSQWITP